MRIKYLSDILFKLILLIILGFSALELSNFYKKQSEIGRYQFWPQDNSYVIDTKTGAVYYESELDLEPIK